MDLGSIYKFVDKLGKGADELRQKIDYLDELSDAIEIVLELLAKSEDEIQVSINTTPLFEETPKSEHYSKTLRHHISTQAYLDMLRREYTTSEQYLADCVRRIKAGGVEGVI